MAHHEIGGHRGSRAVFRADISGDPAVAWQVVTVAKRNLFTNDFW